MCRTGVGRSSIRCSKCNLWVHYKKCSGLKTLSEDLSYECPRCRGVPGVRPVDGRPFKEVEVGDCVLEAVDRFCYLGDMLSAGGGCMAAATARCRCAWGKFRENLPLLTSKPVPFDLRGHLFSSNVRSSMLHGTETWPMTSAALHRLCRNDRAMIRWICGIKPSDDPSMDELHAKLGICDLAILVREHRLRWFGHVMRSNGEINRVRSRPVPGRKGPGRPKKTWEECVKQDLKVCGLSEAGTQDRLSWRSSVKNSRQEPTPSNGSLPQSMAAPPARRVLGMRTRSFNKTGFDWLIDWQKAISVQNTDWWVSLDLSVSIKANIDTEMAKKSFWPNFHHWLHRKLSNFQLPMQPVIKIAAICHFCPPWYSPAGMMNCSYWILANIPPADNTEITMTGSSTVNTQLPYGANITGTLIDTAWSWSPQCHWNILWHICSAFQ